MQAVEFSTHIEDGIIHLPTEYANYNNTNVRVIMLFNNDNAVILDKKQKLKAAFEQAAALNIFKAIENPTVWQKKQRNEF